MSLPKPTPLNKNKVKDMIPEDELMFWVEHNVDTEGAVAQQFGVRNIPTLLVFKNGEIVDKQVGATSKQVLAAKLDGAM